MKVTLKVLLIKMLGQFRLKHITFTPYAGSSYAGFGGCFYEVYGRLVHVHIGASGLTVGQRATVYQMPQGLRPQRTIYMAGLSDSYSKYSSGEIATNGDVSAYSTAGGYIGIDGYYLI